MARLWILGNTKEGYSVRKTSRKTDPWDSQVWLNGRVIRTDSHTTREQAIEYCHHRAGRHRGTSFFKRKVKRRR